MYLNCIYFDFFLIVILIYDVKVYLFEYIKVINIEEIKFFIRVK